MIPGLAGWHRRSCRPSRDQRARSGNLSGDFVPLQVDGGDLVGGESLQESQAIEPSYLGGQTGGELAKFIEFHRNELF